MKRTLPSGALKAAIGLALLLVPGSAVQATGLPAGKCYVVEVTIGQIAKPLVGLFLLDAWWFSRRGRVLTTGNWGSGSVQIEDPVGSTSAWTGQLWFTHPESRGRFDIVGLAEDQGEGSAIAGTLRIRMRSLNGQWRGWDLRNGAFLGYEQGSRPCDQEAPKASFDLAISGPTVSVVNLTTGSELGIGWLWDWGDGTPQSTARNPPAHTYASPGGTFTISLVASNLFGSDYFQRTVTVSP